MGTEGQQDATGELLKWLQTLRGLDLTDAEVEAAAERLLGESTTALPIVLAQFADAEIMAPTLRAQLPKVEVVADPEIESLFPALQRAVGRITTTDGKELTKQVDYPKGDPRNPLTDREVEEKFEAGDAFVLEPGHTPIMHAGLEYVEFSPTEALNQTMAVAAQNMAKMGIG